MRECKLCGKATPQLMGAHCTRCDKIVGDVNADIAAEQASREVVV
jgi:hypothetical protein